MSSRSTSSRTARSSSTATLTGRDTVRPYSVGREGALSGLRPIYDHEPEMRAARALTVVGCHAGGEVGNVVVGGVLPPPGASVFERMEALRADDSLRRLLLREPRGSVAVHANLIVPSNREDCAAGFIIMEPTEYPPMSGSNAMCVATVLLETGMVQMAEPETRFKLEAPAGVVEIVATCEAGRCTAVEFTNVPSFADRLEAAVEVEGIG